MNGRQFFRLPFRTPVLVGTQHMVSAGLSSNLSSGGLWSNTIHLLETGEEVRCAFLLGQDHRQADPFAYSSHRVQHDPFVCRGVVKRIRHDDTNNLETEPGLAVQFIDVTAQEQQRLDDFLEKNYQNIKVASTLLSSAEPDFVSAQELVSSMSLPAFRTLGEARVYIERVLISIEKVKK